MRPFVRDVTPGFRSRVGQHPPSLCDLRQWKTAGAQASPCSHEDSLLRCLLQVQGSCKSNKRTFPPFQAPSYTNVFADALIAEAERDSRIVGIHAAMGGGTGLNRFDARCAEDWLWSTAP